MSVVTDKINSQIESLLEQGVIPWRQSWTHGRPKNMFTGSVYRGVNRFTLFDGEYWATLKQINEHGGRLKTGSKSRYIAFYTSTTKNKDGETENLGYWCRKYYWVFNYQDCIFPQEIIDKYIKPPIEAEQLPRAENIIQDYIIKSGVKLDINKMNDPAYNIPEDKVKMPPIETFDKPERYYQAMFHELGHSTGAKNRLKREIQNSFGDKLYAREELVAELTSCYLMHDIGQELPLIENTAGYIQGWLKAIKDDPEILFKSASKAEQSYDYIRGA
jgi:antirestriction protein ArdC